ncbi:NAD(P)-binding protein [Bimuria novae-zelandiae CBS 107.79]|uniref:NAD(P)-binding protein n=1 Tax=Bimuria novae-zelandiae CBS 107.79 TaxID=1447943 RepID=A0A6A5UUS2_9PLEO|nr:NAD(P)-binding protein [Bimuria novae-zelandiae CBS 107.79]
MLDGRKPPQDFIAKRHSTTYDYISPLKLDLAGKHVLVTGAAWEDGVGYATATAFARTGASAITVVDLHGVSDELVSKLKTAVVQAGRPEPDVLSRTVDIAKPEDVQALRETVAARFGECINVIINNAAHMEPYAPFLETDPDVYWRTWDVNLHGLINMARAFLPSQLSSRSSDNTLCTMINVASREVDGDHADRVRGEGLLTFYINPRAIKTKITEGTPEPIRNMLPGRPDIAGDTIVWLAAWRKEWLGGRYVSCPWDMEVLISRKDEIVEGDKFKLKVVF